MRSVPATLLTNGEGITKRAENIKVGMKKTNRDDDRTGNTERKIIKRKHQGIPFLATTVLAKLFTAICTTFTKTTVLEICYDLQLLCGERLQARGRQKLATSFAQAGWAAIRLLTCKAHLSL